MAAIQCAHCGGTHSNALAVKACWQSGGGGSGAVPAPPAPLPAPARSVAASGRPAAHLGRGVLIAPGRQPPAEWADAPRLALGSGGSLPEQLDQLLEHHFARRPVVVELDGDWSQPSTESVDLPPWSLDPGFSFPGENLRAALGNCLDARSDGLRWRPAETAIRLGARPGGPADVVLPNGQPAFCDGGPLRFPAGDSPGTAPGTAVLHHICLEHSSLQPFGHNRSTAQLADDQRAAVTHADGSARIIAPAGSGKTRVLTERARHLIRAWGIPAQAICLVAFNKRAADEMRDRSTDLPGLQVRSLNALGLAVLSGSGRFGAGSAVETIDERTVRNILDSLVRFGRRANADPAAAWIEALSSVRLGLRPPAEVEADFAGDVAGLPEIFEAYRDKLASNRVVDFDEQIYRAIEVLLSDPAARSRARPVCRVMLVDEFQDLTPAHLLLIRLLAGPTGAVYGVGDDDQTIYGYAGASPDWLIDYRRYFPGAGSHSLGVNYRCPPPVVSCVRTLLTHNRRRVSKDISAAQQAPDTALRVVQSDDAVAATVQEVIDRLEEGASPSDLAVLTRVNNSLAPIQILLADRKIPVNQAVNPHFLERTGVKAALGWLRIAVQPRRLGARDVSFTARRPPRSLSPKAIDWMSEQGSPDRLRALADRLSDRDASKIHSYVEDLEMLAALADRGASAHDLLLALKDQVGLANSMAALDGQRRRLDRSPQTDDLDILIALGKIHGDPYAFSGWLSAGLSVPGDPNGVTLASIHAVKGREWDHVVVHDVTSGLLPHRLAPNLEEERRVFHVGLTRGRRSVVVTAGDPPSPFLEQMSRASVPPDPSLPVRDRQPEQVQTAAAAAAPSAACIENLRQWRLAKARELGKPAFTIMHDKTLEALAASGCRELADLSQIRGIGPAKLELYGREILAILDEAAAQ